jgi:hypothetical protein
MEQYVQTDLEADREVANTLADLIIDGLRFPVREPASDGGIANLNGAADDIPGQS